MKNICIFTVFGKRSTFLQLIYCILLWLPSNKGVLLLTLIENWKMPSIMLTLGSFVLYHDAQRITGQTIVSVIPPATKLWNAHSSSNWWPFTGCIQLNNATCDWQPEKKKLYKEPNSKDLMTQADIIIIISSSNYLANRRANALTFALCSANTDGCLWPTVLSFLRIAFLLR